MHGSTSNKFGLYYGKSGDDKEEKFRWTKKYGNTADEALQEIKKQLVYLRMAGEKRDLEAIRKCEFASLLEVRFVCILSRGLFVYFLGQAFGLFYKEAWDHK